MPRRRRKFRRKRKSAGVKALAMVRSMKRQIEKKEHVIKATDVAFNSTPTVIQLTNLVTGDSNTTRDGSKVMVTSFTFNYFVQRHASASRTIWRIMLVQDKQTNGAEFDPSELLQDDTVLDNLVSPYNTDNNHRFRVLYDELAPGKSANSAIWVRKIFKKVRIPLTYDASAGTIADLTSNSLALLIMSDEDTNTPVMTYNVRLRYEDL